MDEKLFDQERKSYMKLGEIYFWTATINSWIDLLEETSYKDVIVESLQYLSAQGKVDVFAFVIMPTHIHLIWRLKTYNGKETTSGAFLKFTAHRFKKLLFQQDYQKLNRFKVTASNKKFEFWQRDSLAVHLFSPKVAYQKLAYIHANPSAGRWRLATEPADYRYSSAAFYERDEKSFDFLRDLREEF